MPDGQTPGQTPTQQRRAAGPLSCRLKMPKKAPVIRYRRPADRRTRPQRWRDAVAELLTLQADYMAWLDALPESLQDTPTAMALQAIIDLDLDELAAIVPPRGYGRD